MASELIRGFLSRLPAAPGRYEPLVRLGQDRVAGNFYKAQLASAFQPILGRDDAIVGHEAFIRSHVDGATELSPWQLFAEAASDDELVRLDRLCRTVHAINYFAIAPADTQLFLGVETRLLAAVPGEHGRAFERVLTSLGLAPRRVVIQLPAAANRNPVLVGHVIANYRHCGYGVAVTHRPGDPVTLEHTALFRPDFVRLRSAEFSDSELRETVRRVHDAGALAIVSHVEAAAALAKAREAGADLVQGYHLGVPQPDAWFDRPFRLPARNDDTVALAGAVPLI
jgi:EAL domain-containing protein (putative c-di-GMP-specific phosphodiesterase class I)